MANRLLAARDAPPVENTIAKYGI
ncbi:hypothetical protein FOC1_g10000111 [Fusarium oxysporum f. sp. cubense race 1]|uniref:Uncharacterized protein n=1 Tax=Fusarium oxysporum f. sp. cubense (strain race 1) TaxID=1229664 RepID=N4UC14_FUSC1|nr:hypothetical protein FOC1_g10000111 [Fusarium oxysporum f. sp. cubense race 1]